ncbi:MAG: hypothetical protein LBQ58_06800 [Synergistaceae bacterium]|jgi:hypothetical protein|nr:hypothetical protein [Synergistaceae bacterium]
MRWLKQKLKKVYLVERLYRYCQHIIKRDIHSGVTCSHVCKDFVRFIKKRSNADCILCENKPFPILIYKNLLEYLSVHDDFICMTVLDYVSNKIDKERINVVLRHDLDSGCSEVLKLLCNTEKKLNIRSSVHVLMDKSCYDATAMKPLLLDLYRDGFDIGLHTVAWMYENYADMFMRESAMFAEILGFSPKTLSIHGAWPRSDVDMERRKIFESQLRLDLLLKDTSFIGYNGHYDWASEDSRHMGKDVPLKNSFLTGFENCYRGDVCILLTHDNGWA